MTDRNPKRERGLRPSLTFRVMIDRKTTYDYSYRILHWRVASAGT